MIVLEAKLLAVVAIPVSNESERIGACLASLVDQHDMPSGSYGILLFLNNCIDGTAEIVAEVVARTGGLIRVIKEDYPQATAGWARRRAMEAASAWLSSGGVDDGLILTTDADTRVGATWIADNLACVVGGADAVAGKIVLDHDEAALLPDRLHARGRLESEYEALLTEIGARIDPESWNPWPCHWTTSGATLAVRRTVYHRVGGMPALRAGEDRAFVEALRADDARVRHAPDIVVVTSGRLDGRAVGGAADTMRARCENDNAVCDPRLEPLLRAVRRVLWRRRLRRLHAACKLPNIDAWAPFLRLDRAVAHRAAAYATFGRAFAAIEAASPSLAFRPLRPSALPMQIRLARLLVGYLRRRPLPSVGRQVDIDPFGTDAEPAGGLPSSG